MERNTLCHCAFVLLATLLAERTEAQLLVDYAGDTPHPEGAYLEQLGQKFDTNGDERPDIFAYTQGMFPEVYAMMESRLSFVFPLSAADSVTGAMDLGKVWCEPVGEGARQRTPAGKGAIDTRYGFLDPRQSDPIFDVAGFIQVWYEDVWPDIDVILASNQSGPVLYFVCKVGSNPSDINLQFHGQDSLKFVDEGMTIYKQEKWIRLPEATAYQLDDNDNVTDVLDWTGDWVPNDSGGVASLTFDEYDTDQRLVFKVGYPEAPPAPPTATPEWCTYLSSPSLSSWVTGSYATQDGGLYVCGHAGILDFPASPFQNSVLPSQNGYLAFFNDEHHKDWSYFFGPSARTVTADESGEDPVVYVAGGSATNGNLLGQDRDLGNADDYFHASTSGTFDRSWVACFQDHGIGPNGVTLLWSTHFRAQEITSMVMRENGELWMTGVANTELEQVAGGEGSPWIQPANYDQSAFIARFSPASELIWCSWIGGGYPDWGLDIALHEGADRVAVVGQTKSNAYQDEDCEFAESPPFPLHDGGHWFYCACGGNSSCPTVPDGFIALFNLDGERQSISYFGGRGSTASSVDFDPAGNLYVAGHVTNAVYTTGSCAPPSATNPGFPHCTAAGWFDVGELSTTGGAHYLARFSPDLELQWSTFLNSAGDFSGIWQLTYPEIGRGLNLPQVDVDESGAVYFAGSTLAGSGSNTQDPFPLQAETGLYYTDVNQDAGVSNPAPYFNSGQDIYLVKLSSTGAPLWGTFFGGRGTNIQPDWFQGGGDLLCELKVRNDRVYIGGCTNSYTNLPLIGTSPAYINGSPPAPMVIDGPNIWHGFLANLSELLNFDVSVAPVASQQAGVSAFPSPTDNQLTLQLGEGQFAGYRITVYDATGRSVLVLSGRQAGARLTLDVSGLAPGVYRGQLTGYGTALFSFVKR